MKYQSRQKAQSRPKSGMVTREQVSRSYRANRRMLLGIIDFHIFLAGRSIG